MPSVRLGRFVRLKISSRKSDLARLQVYRVVDELKKNFKDLDLDLNFRESLGDKNLTDPLWKLPEKGVFTEDFYKDLLEGKTDVVVHSWKDLPTEPKPETEIIATLHRADQRDLFIFKKTSEQKLISTHRISIYSSSPRRAYNLEPFFKEHLPGNCEKIEFQSVRGNIQTRIRKLFESAEIDGLIVAKAAIDRLLEAHDEDLQETRKLVREHLAKCNWMVLPLSVNPSAAAQGAIAIEVLKTNQKAKDIFSKINVASAYSCVQEERNILSSYGGGCHQKIGVTVLDRPFGRVFFLKGKTDQGQILDEAKIISSQNIPRFKESEIFSSSILSQCFKRVPVASEIPNSDVTLVAKADAWPEGHRTTGLVWAAGNQTWKALAKKGVWVSGSQDGLGEKEGTNIETLCGKKLTWIKLSHADTKSDLNMTTTKTYKLEQTEKLPDLRAYKSFYWTSGYFFLKAVEAFPEIRDSWHSCGPGNTYDIIADSLTNKRLGVFLDQTSWRNYVLS